LCNPIDAELVIGVAQTISMKEKNVLLPVCIIPAVVINML